MYRLIHYCSLTSDAALDFRPFSRASATKRGGSAFLTQIDRMPILLHYTCNPVFIRYYFLCLSSSGSKPSDTAGEAVHLSLLNLSRLSTSLALC